MAERGAQALATLGNMTFKSKSAKKHWLANQRKRKYHLAQAERSDDQAPEVSVSACSNGSVAGAGSMEKAARLHAESTMKAMLQSSIGATRAACIRGLAPPVHDGTKTLGVYYLVSLQSGMVVVAHDDLPPLVVSETVEKFVKKQHFQSEVPVAAQHLERIVLLATPTT